MVGALITLAWYGILTPEAGVSAFLCFIGSLLITYRRDALGAVWGSLAVALGVAVLAASYAGLVVGGASFLMVWGSLLLISRALLRGARLT